MQLTSRTSLFPRISESHAGLNRIGLLSRGVISNWAGLIIGGTVAFAITPIMIHRLGGVYYGIWALANSVLTYYMLFDLGLSTTVQRYVALYNTTDREGTIETVSTATAIMTAIAAVIALATLAIAIVLPRFGIVSANLVHVFRIVVILLGGSVAVTFPARPAGAYLRGLHRFDLANGISVGATVLRAGGIWVMLQQGHGIIAVSVVTFVSSSLSLGTYLFVLLVKYRALKLARCFRWHRICELCQFSFYVFLLTIGDYFRFHLDLLVVAKVIGVAFVTPYSIASNLIGWFTAVISGMAGPIMTELTGRHGDQGLREGTLFFLRSSKLTALLATFVASLLLANGRQLLQVWLGSQFASVYATLAVLTIAHWADLGQGPSMHLIYCRARHRPMAFWTVTEGIVNLLLSIYLARRYGIIGVAIGTAIPMLIIKIVVQPLYTLHVAGISVLEYVGEAIIRPVAVGLLVVLNGLALSISGKSLHALIFNVLWQTALFAVAAYFFALTHEERTMLSQPGSRVLAALRLRASEEA